MSILYKDNYTLQKTKSYNKNCWSLIYNMNYGLKSCLHKSQIYKKKISSGLAVALLKFSVVITLTGHMPFFKVENGYLKGSMKLSCTLLWR